MKTIVLFSDNDQFRVDLKVDLFDTSEAFTIMEIGGRSDAEVQAGLDLQELPNDIESIAVYAAAQNLQMDIIDIDPAVPTINKVTTFTALNITTTGAMAVGNDTVAYREQVLTEGGNGELAFSVTSGVLPTGLTLDTISGFISGTPTVVENQAFEITITDGFGQTDVQVAISIDIQA